MYVVDLYTVVIKPAARGSEPMSLSFVAQMPWKQDLIKCLESESYQLQSQMTKAVKDEDEIKAANLADDIANHELCLQMLKVDKMDNYRAADNYQLTRNIEYAGVNLGTMQWSDKEVWQ